VLIRYVKEDLVAMVKESVDLVEKLTKKIIEVEKLTQGDDTADDKLPKIINSLKATHDLTVDPMFTKIQYKTKSPAIAAAKGSGRGQKQDDDEEEPEVKESGQDKPQKSYKLDNNTPIFGNDGKTDNVDEWLFTVENAFEAINVPNEKKLNVVAPYLRKLPLQALVKYQSSQQDANWEDFAVLLKNTFKPADYMKKLKLKLRDLKQTESFESYLNRFRSIVNQIDDMTEQDQMLWFSEGLHPKTKFEVNSKNCQSLEEAILVATQFESCFGREKQVGINYTRPFSQRRDLSFKKFPQKKFGEKRNLAPNFSSRKPVKCFKCQKIGHTSNVCRSNGEVGQKPNFGAAKTGFQKGKPRTIAVCRPNEESILSTEGKLDGKNVRFSLDIGAVSSIISERTARRLGLKISASEVQVKTATNEVQRVRGETDKLMVDIEGHTCHLAFLVLDMQDHEVLLGLDFFEETGAGVFPQEKLLRFPSHTIHLSKEQNYSQFDHNEIEVYSAEIVDEPDIAVEMDWDTSKDVKMIPNEKLSPSQMKEFSAVYRKNKSVFATGLNDLGNCKINELKIKLKDETPIFKHPYRKSIRERKEIQIEIDKMLEAGIIRPSSSPWSSPVIIFHK